MPRDTDDGPENRRSGAAGLIAWCSYDWANSAFPTVIVTFVFAAYYAKAVAADEIAGTQQWSTAMGVAMFAAALLGPVLGAIADRGGRRKPWVAFFTVVTVLATAALYWAEPKTPDVLWVLAAFAIANCAFETGTIFYNAMLGSIAPPGMLGRVSGWGWGLGYVGGLACLVVALVLLIQPDPPLFGLDKAAAEPVRASALLTAAWFALFSLPFFLLTPDVPGTGVPAGQAIREGVRTMLRTLRQVHRYRNIARYLVAHMIYTDGLNTLFSVGGIYAAVTFRMDFDELLLFGIALNVTAGIGAFAFGWVDDRVGPKRTILVALACLTALGTGILLVEDKTAFWGLALAIGIFLGPTQAASRSLMARIAPPTISTEMFGLYSLAGKATAFMGPMAFGLVTSLSGSQRIGLSTLLLFFIVGGGLLLKVSEQREET